MIQPLVQLGWLAVEALLIEAFELHFLEQLVELVVGLRCWATELFRQFLHAFCLLEYRLTMIIWRRREKRRPTSASRALRPCSSFVLRYFAVLRKPVRTNEDAASRLAIHEIVYFLPHLKRLRSFLPGLDR